MRRRSCTPFSFEVKDMSVKQALHTHTTYADSIDTADGMALAANRFKEVAP